MENKTEKMNNGFFKMPEYFFDYGLQVFTHTEYDIIQYILRNTIGWNKLECDLSIKNMALMRCYSEKNIIKSIKNLIEKTGVFSKVVYREKGSCIKKTKYIITENSVNILNDYVRQNIPNDFNERKEKLKNRIIEATERIENEKQKLLEKQNILLPVDDTENNECQNETENGIKSENKIYLLDAIQEIINDYDKNECRYDTFNEYKKVVFDAHLCYVPIEKDEEKIDIRLSDLLNFTDDNKTINFYNALIKNKKMIGGQKDLFFNTLKINFGIINERNFDRINVIYE